MLSAYPFLTGAAVCVIPNLFFWVWLHRFRRAKPRSFLGAFYCGEAAKFLLTGLLFLIAIRSERAQPILFFAGFILTQSLFWLMLLVKGTPVGKAVVDESR